jgi:hypothetical protein
MEKRRELTRSAAIKRITGNPEMVNLGKVVDLTSGGNSASKDYSSYAPPVYVDRR